MPAASDLFGEPRDFGLHALQNPTDDPKCQELNKRGVAKLLFTTAPLECAPFLEGSPEWQVNRHTADPKTKSVLNTNIKGGVYEHEGCRMRLAGPVDNEKSSCISCHAGAYAAPAGAPSNMGINTPNIFGFDGLCDQYSQDNVNYFQNSTPPQAYHGGQFPNALNLDTSLQMQVAFTQYGLYNTNGQPNECVDPQ